MFSTIILYLVHIREDVQTFEKARDKKTHITKSHTKANFKCDLCPRSFGYLKNLNIHKEKHDEGNNNNPKKVCTEVCILQLIA